MKVLEFLNELKDTTAGLDESLEKLTEEFGIKVARNEYFPELFVLNYCQINSSKQKTHDIVRECRSLVVRGDEVTNEFSVVSRAFDRFFNHGETDEEVDIVNCLAHEKLDGSLVTVFNYKRQWVYRTKSMIMPADDLKMPSGRSWKDLIESLLIGPFEWEGCSYIFEVVSRDNRVVTRYDGDCAYLLAIRNNETGEYLKDNMVLPAYQVMSKISKVRMPHVHRFDSIEHCLESARELPNLEEGYVIYNKEGVPVAKMKSPAYVAAHRLRGESVLTPKRIIDMILTNEQDEYLAIFPEDTEAFEPLIEAYHNLRTSYGNKILELSKITDRKEFAMEAKNYSFGSLLFRSFGETKPFDEVFECLTLNAKRSMIEKMV